MNLAYTTAPGKGDTDELLYRLAETLIGKGLRPAGTVQINTDCPGAGPCDMDVKVLPAGPVIRISQSLGPAARGCRLDPEALEGAVRAVEDALADADCLIVNKFGKHEAEGRGFREVIAAALASGIPVLVGLNPLNQAAFEEFSGGLAEEVPPDAAALEEWLGTAIAGNAAAA